MPRGKRKIPKRNTIPDAIYNSPQITIFINKVMRGGKKTLAQKIVYQALKKAGEIAQKEPLEIFKEALSNVAPSQEVRSRRVGGATYQIPIPVRTNRKETLAMRWIIGAANNRQGKPMVVKLAEELIAASKNEGSAIKKKEDTHKMAEANRAFAHFRW